MRWQSADAAAICKRSGLLQAEFARSISVALGTLRGWEQGRRRHEDLVAFAGAGGLKTAEAKSILADVCSAVSKWRSFAKEAGVANIDSDRIERAQRRELMA